MGWGERRSPNDETGDELFVSSFVLRAYFPPIRVFAGYRSDTGVRVTLARERTIQSGSVIRQNPGHLPSRRVPGHPLEPPPARRGPSAAPHSVHEAGNERVVLGPAGSGRI